MKTQIETELNNLRELAASISGGSLHLNDAIANLESLLAEPAPLKLEYGKRYVTRDGRITAPLCNRHSECSYYYTAKIGGSDSQVSWTSRGKWSNNHDNHDRDLVSEYIEEITDPETIEARQCGRIYELESRILKLEANINERNQREWDLKARVNELESDNANLRSALQIVCTVKSA